MKTYCAFLIVIIVIYTAIALRLQLKVDFLNLKGRIKIYFAFIKILDIKFRVVKMADESARIIYGNKKYAKFLRLNADSEDKNSIINWFGFDFVPKINYTKIKCRVKIGKNDDAFATVVLMQIAKSFLCFLFSYLKSKQLVEIDEEFIPTQNAFTIESNIKIRVSIAETTTDLIDYFILKKKKKLAKKES